MELLKLYLLVMGQDIFQHWLFLKITEQSFEKSQFFYLQIDINHKRVILVQDYFRLEKNLKELEHLYETVCLYN